MSPTAADVAIWMLDALKKEDGLLYQHHVAYDIEEKFGEDFVYYNNNGNIAISKAVLSAFNKLTGDSVVWERGQRLWRYREDYDEPGRQQR